MPDQKHHDDLKEEQHIGPRVRMRVKVKPLGTSLPLAHDAKWAAGGSNRVKQGEHEIIVFRADIPRVMAKVEEDVVTLRLAHQTFWSNATEAVRTALAGTPYADAELPLPPFPTTISPNRWVDKEWQDPRTPVGQPSPIVQAYNEWLKGVTEFGGSPETIFRGLKGRPPRPLESAVVLDGPDLPPPLYDEQRAALAIAEHSRTAAAASAPAPDLAALAARLDALEAENARLRKAAKQ